MGNIYIFIAWIFLNENQILVSAKCQQQSVKSHKTVYRGLDGRFDETGGTA